MVKKILWEKYSSRKKDEEEESSVSDNLPFKAYLDRTLKFPEDDYNLWLIHTNFPIMESDMENLQEILGLETLDVFSPYRVRIGIGKLFDVDKVKAEIEFNLNSSESLDGMPDDIKKSVEALIESFKEDKWWLILVLPNGKISSYMAKSEEDFKEKFSLFEQIKDATGSQLLTS